MSTKEKLPVSQKMRLIHDSKRPTIDDYVKTLFDDFTELHGDRGYADDSAICAGIAVFQGTPVTVIGHRKGKTTEENIRANFAMAHPEGYRKALRLAKQAEKFHRPVICFVDTAGAFVELAQRNVDRVRPLRVVSVILWCCGLRSSASLQEKAASGGALALAVADCVLMLENAIYSVISPRGCASILWKDASREVKAAERLKITADRPALFWHD